MKGLLGKTDSVLEFSDVSSVGEISVKLCVLTGDAANKIKGSLLTRICVFGFSSTFPNNLNRISVIKLMQQVNLSIVQERNCVSTEEEWGH